MQIGGGSSATNDLFVVLPTSKIVVQCGMTMRVDTGPLGASSLVSSDTTKTILGDEIII